MRNTVIAGYARSPFHFATKGALARVRPDDLAAQVIRGLIERSKVDFPHPLGPRRATNSPRPTCKLMRSNTGSGCPSRSKRWLTSRSVSVDPWTA